jgi:predicted LPLAT superfamily acyltransferase
MSRAWLEQPERGSLFALRLMARFALFFGWRASRLLLYPITAYFLLFAPVARRASRQFLERVLGPVVSLGDVYRHLFCFASVILDRVYFLSGRADDYRIDVVGADAFEAAAARGGVVLLGSHLGSFEVMRLLAMRRAIKVRPLMYEANAARMRAVFGRLNPALAAEVIALGEPTAMLQVKESLARGECVGFLGDRIAGGDKTIAVDFLGRPAELPAGPFLVAAALKAPVVMFFGLHRGPRHYEVRFQGLDDGGGLPAEAGDDRNRRVQPMGQRYADCLAFHVRLAPYNWFNFFDFWERPGDGAG